MLIKQFVKYTSVGVINTLIHWLVFVIMHFILLLDQGISNLLGFLFAVIFSFFINAKYTFRKKTSLLGFILYSSFLGILSFLIGRLSDSLNISFIFTLVFFSMISLIIGFIYSKYIVFRG